MENKKLTKEDVRKVQKFYMLLELRKALDAMDQGEVLNGAKEVLGENYTTLANKTSHAQRNVARWCNGENNAPLGFLIAIDELLSSLV